MRLTLTLADGLPRQAMQRVIQEARRVGAQEVNPLFPDAPLPELKRFYMVDVPDHRATELITALRTLEGVLSVERGPERRPV